MVERAQPWLGTYVRIRVDGLSPSRTHQAMDAAFNEIATVHRLMSFHECDSDVSRLNRDAAFGPIAVDPYTFDVLQWALEISRACDGSFDVSVAPELVEAGLLPRPTGAVLQPNGCWRDIELCGDCRVMFHRPLWIDLGGIAKGYAVDRATECLRHWGTTQAVVNAGGDLRVLGRRTERVGLELETLVDAAPILELSEASIASSSGHRNRRYHQGQSYGPHMQGTLRCPAPTRRFVCVVAERCVVADALTKVVMAEGARSADVLESFRASAHFHDPLDGWRHLNGGTEC